MTDANINQTVAVIKLHGNLTVGLNIDKIHQRVAADVALAGSKHNGQVLAFRLIFRQLHNRRDSLAGIQRQQINERFALRRGRTQRQLINLHLINQTLGREEQNRRVGGSHKQTGNKIFVFGCHGRLSFAAALLRLISVKRNTLDITGFGNRNHHILTLNQRFNVGVVFNVFNL